MNVYGAAIIQVRLRIHDKIQVKTWFNLKFITCHMHKQFPEWFRLCLILLCQISQKKVQLQNALDRTIIYC